MPEESTPPPEPLVQLGSHVLVELLDSSGETQQLEFDLVPDSSADFSRGYLGLSTPLAQAILSQPAGAVLPYQQADILQATVLSVAPPASLPLADLAQQREEAARKALQQVQQTAAMIFASSFSGKWGDYDPEGITHWEEPQPPETPTNGEGSQPPENPAG
jgi:hypothetical protein